MNLIFLDFDEVLTNLVSSYKRAMAKREKKEINTLKYSYNDKSPEAIDFLIHYKAKEVNPVNFANFNDIVKATDSKIVISSTWRKITPFVHNNPEIVIERFNKLFSILGYPNLKVIDFTDDFSIRGIEIATFLTNFSKHHKVDNYIILDDGGDFLLNKISIEDFNKIKFYNERRRIDYSTYEELCDEYPSFWQNQKLLRINPLTGLSTMDTLLVIKELNPEHRVVEMLDSYENFIQHYGLHNGSDMEKKITQSKKNKLK